MPVSQKKRDLKGEIAQVFVDTVRTEGIEKVCVLDIAKELNVNKNSFYYHFSSKYSVIYWIFRTDITAMLNEHFASDQLVYLEGESHGFGRDGYPDMPYYVRIPQGARMLDQGAFFKEAVLRLRQRRDFYRCVMRRDTSVDSLMSYVEKLYAPAFFKDVSLIAGGRYIPPATHFFLAKSFLKLYVGMMEELVCAWDLPEDLLLDSKNPFWNISAESIQEAIRKHPIKSAEFFCGEC